MTIAVLVGRARIALARGEAAEAQRLAERAAEGEGPAPCSDGLRPCGVLGGALAAEENIDKAEAVLRRALELDREIEGDDGLATARSSAALGNVLLRQKRYAEALPLIEDAARIDRSRLGPNHPYLADDFHDIGVVYLETGRPQAAVKALRYAVDLLDRDGGRDTPRFAYVEMTLARAETRLGREPRAKALFDDASRILGAAEREERQRAKARPDRVRVSRAGSCSPRRYSARLPRR